MLTRGSLRVASTTRSLSRAIATSAPSHAAARSRGMDPELEEILSQPTLDEHALSKYVRHMTPEQMLSLGKDASFQKFVRENPQARQAVNVPPPRAQVVDEADDAEYLEDGFYGPDAEEEEEGFGESQSDLPSYADWEDKESSSSRSADPLADPRRRGTARFSEVAIDAAAPSASTAELTPSQLRRRELESAMHRYRIGTVQLPKLLAQRIAEVLHGYPRAWLRKDAKQLSETLRARTTENLGGTASESNVNLTKFAPDPVADALKLHVRNSTPVPPLPYNKRQALAYVAHRVPGIFACNYKALVELKMRFGDFAPSTMLDFGSGPGTAVWAAKEIWPSIKAIVAVEPSEHMTHVSESLLKDFPVVRRKYLDQGKRHYYDLVVASYAMSELRDEAARVETTRQLWEHVAVGGVLILIEPGTPVAFRMVRNARSTILDALSTSVALNPTILAPCTHNGTCPMAQDDWCHFTQRVQRIPQQIAAKSADKARMNYENEKYSYVIAAKGAPEWMRRDAQGGREWARLIRQPIKRGGHVIVDVCSPKASLDRLLVSKGMSPKLYTSARKATWGDLYDSNEARSAAAEKKLKPKRPWKDLYEARKLKREEKARAAAASPTIFANLTANYAAHKLVGKRKDARDSL